MATPIKGIRVRVKGKLGVKGGKLKRHVLKGRVHAVHGGYDGQHATIEVLHGRAPKLGGKKGAGPTAASFGQPSSSIALPAHLAKHYPHGARVQVSIARDDMDGDEGVGY